MNEKLNWDEFNKDKKFDFPPENWINDYTIEQINNIVILASKSFKELFNGNDYQSVLFVLQTMMRATEYSFFNALKEQGLSEDNQCIEFYKKINFFNKKTYLDFINRTNK